jgi:hypothetical protein
MSPRVHSLPCMDAIDGQDNINLAFRLLAHEPFPLQDA